MARLPTPGQDNGNWGEILNDFLEQSHNNDGSIKEAAIPKSTNVTTDGSSDSKVPSVKAVKDYTDGKVGEVNTQLDAKANSSDLSDILTNRNIISFDAASWEQGSIGAGGEISSTIRLRTPSAKAVLVKYGNTYSIKFSSTYFQLLIIEYNAAGTYITIANSGAYYATNSTYTPSNANVAKVRFVLKPLAAVDPLTTAHLTNLSIAMNVPPLVGCSFNVMSYNAGKWYDGVTKVPDVSVDSQTTLIRAMFANSDCKVVLGQEMVYYLNVGNTILAYNQVLSNRYYQTGIAPSAFGQGLALLLSKDIRVVDVAQTLFSGSSDRGYIKAHILLNGRTVCLITTHLTLTDADKPGEIAELIAAMSGETYVILGGDFNVDTMGEFDAFITAGYNLINGGWFGTFITHPTSNLPIDNIVVSSNIQIEKVYLDTTGTSDHTPIIAKVTLV